MSFPTRKKRIAAIQKRILWLKSRIEANPTFKLSFDVREQEALEWALAELLKLHPDLAAEIQVPGPPLANPCPPGPVWLKLPSGELVELGFFRIVDGKRVITFGDEDMARLLHFLMSPAEARP